MMKCTSQTIRKLSHHLPLYQPSPTPKNISRKVLTRNSARSEEETEITQRNNRSFPRTHESQQETEKRDHCKLNHCRITFHQLAPALSNPLFIRHLLPETLLYPASHSSQISPTLLPQPPAQSLIDATNPSRCRRQSNKSTLSRTSPKSRITSQYGRPGSRPRSGSPCSSARGVAGHNYGCAAGLAYAVESWAC